MATYDHEMVARNNSSSIRKKIVMRVMMEKKKASWKSLLEVHFKSHLGQLTREMNFFEGNDRLLIKFFVCLAFN